MSTTAEKLQVIIDNKEAIKQAIIDKGGQVGDFTTYAEAIANLPSGGGDVNPTAKKNDVTFYDYDGTIRYSYTAEKFLALTEMPPLPTQQRLTCQGWNYDIADAKTYVSKYGKLNIGATYITYDGKTRLYIRIAAEGRMDVPLYFNQSVANGVVIDWGDGSVTQTFAVTGKVNTTHTYASIGDYCITLTVASGCTLSLGSGSSSYCVMGSTGSAGRIYCHMLQKVELGNNITSIGSYAFSSCYSLSSIVIPLNVTSFGASVLRSCPSLSSIVIPSNATYIDESMFHSCYTLSSVSIPSKVTSIKKSGFYNCSSLSSILIPSNVTSIGESAFTTDYSLSSVVIPPNVTSIAASAFAYCYCMLYYDFSYHTSVPTLSNTNAFSSIPSDCKIIVPDSLYSTWKTTTNWSSYKSQIVKKSEWDSLKQ